jgi:hypothetical protein
VWPAIDTTQLMEPCAKMSCGAPDLLLDADFPEHFHGPCSGCRRLVLLRLGVLLEQRARNAGAGQGRP